MSDDAHFSPQRRQLLRGLLFIGIILGIWVLVMSGVKSVQCAKVASFLSISPQYIEPSGDHPLLTAGCFLLRSDDGTKAGYALTRFFAKPSYVGYYSSHGPHFDCACTPEKMVAMTRDIVTRCERCPGGHVEPSVLQNTGRCPRAIIECSIPSKSARYEITVNKETRRVVSIRRENI